MSSLSFFDNEDLLAVEPSRNNPFYFPSSPSVFDSLSADAAGAVYNTPWDEPQPLSDHSSDASPQLSPVQHVPAAVTVPVDEPSKPSRPRRAAAAAAAAVLIKHEPVEDNDENDAKYDAVDPMAAVRAATLARPFGVKHENTKDADYTPATPLFKAPAVTKAQPAATRKTPARPRGKKRAAGGRAKKRGRKRDHPELNESEYRRMVKEKHLAIERRRREQINESIESLRQLVPECQPGEFKGNVLVKTVDYLRKVEEELAFYRRNFRPHTATVDGVHDVRVAAVHVPAARAEDAAEEQQQPSREKRKKGGFESAVEAVLRMSKGGEGKLRYSPSLGATPPLSSLNLHLPPLGLGEEEEEEGEEEEQTEEEAAGLGMCVEEETAEEETAPPAQDIAATPPPEQLVSQPRGLNWSWIGFLLACMVGILAYPLLAEAHATFATAPTHGHLISTGLAACGVVEMVPLAVSFVRACMAAQHAPAPAVQE